MGKRFALIMMASMTLAVFSGCCSRTCVEPTAASAIRQNWLDPSKIKEMKTHRGQPLREAIKGPVFKAESRPPGQDHLNVLVLSGGGQNGAFGAGFLNGLAQGADDLSDLNFDIVTGISTGALQATFAFLGPDYYDMLESFYLNLSQDDIFVHRFFPSQLW